MNRRLIWIAPLALAAGSSRAEPVLPSGKVERVEVQSFYLCDGYSSFGDASFYDCARRFFRDAAAPAQPALLAGAWWCRSAFNGPSANWQQPLLVAHEHRKKSKSRDAIDRLFVMPTGEPLSAKAVRKYVGQSSERNGMVIQSMAGEILHSANEWTSTPWDYGERPTGFNLAEFERKSYSQRTTFRVREGHLLLEHVVREADKQQLIALLQRRAAPRDGPDDAMYQAALKTLLKDNDALRSRWTEQSLKDAAPIAELDADWTLPILYSECRPAEDWVP